MKTQIIIAILIVSNTATSTLFAQTKVPQSAPPASLAALAGGLRTFTDLSATHSNYTADFATKPGFGYGRMFFLPPQDMVVVKGKTYRFNSPDLIGLEDAPVVYQRAGGIQNLSVDIMSKKELRAQLARRPMTAVESNAVVGLRAGKDLVTYPDQVVGRLIDGRETERVAGLRAVGSLRAQPHCAKCHGVREGTLLGAFSYTLVPTNALASAQPVPSKIKTTPPLTVPAPSHTNLSFTLSRNMGNASKN